MCSVLSTAIPDLYFVPKNVDVFCEGMELFLRSSACGTVVSYASIDTETSYEATQALSEREVNTSKSISVEHEMKIYLNTFSKVKKTVVNFWLTGQKIEPVL